YVVPFCIFETNLASKCPGAMVFVMYVCTMLLCKLYRVVGGMPVYHDNFAWRMGLESESLKAFFDGRCLVSNRNNDANRTVLRDDVSSYDKSILRKSPMQLSGYGLP